jgi:hypothetical protein
MRGAVHQKPVNIHGALRCSSAAGGWPVGLVCLALHTYGGYLERASKNNSSGLAPVAAGR